MAKVDFYYEGRNITIQCNKNDKMQYIFQQFLVKADVNINSVIFLYNGNIVTDTELTFQQLSNIDDKKRNKMNILVGKAKTDSFSQFIFLACKGANESMKEYAKMTILLAMQEHPDSDPDKCSLIRTKFEEKYGGSWSTSMVKEGASSFTYYDYFIGIKLFLIIKLL